MEKAKIDTDVFCPLHPHYTIQAINMARLGGQELFCTMCMLQLKDYSAISQMKAVIELIEMASIQYASQRESVKLAEKPEEFLDLIGGQAEMIEEINQHIEEEKKKTSDFFDLMTQTVIGIIAEKKAEHIRELDKQMTQILDRYADFEKQVKKAYPTEEDIASLYPTYEQLEAKYKGFKTFDQLSSFVKDLKKDLSSNTGMDELVNQKMVKDLYEELQSLRDVRPQYQQNDTLLLEFEHRIKKCLNDFCLEKVVLGAPIPEPSKPIGYESTIATQDDFLKIKNWLPQNSPFNLKLIYQASRDGPNATAFHKYCDGAKNTITLTKVLFEGADLPCVIGGYLDAAWCSNNQFIWSTNAFLFSITKNMKCANTNPQKAAYGGLGYGPVFGPESDLGVYLSCNDYGFVKPGSYVGSAQLVSSPKYPGNGQITFKIFEVEVYTLD